MPSLTVTKNKRGRDVLLSFIQLLQCLIFLTFCVIKKLKLKNQSYDVKAAKDKKISYDHSVHSPNLTRSFRMSLKNIILPSQHLKAMSMFNYSTSIWASGQKVQIYIGISTFYLSPDLNSGLQVSQLILGQSQELLLQDKRMKMSPLYYSMLHHLNTTLVTMCLKQLFVEVCLAMTTSVSHAVG